MRLVILDRDGVINEDSDEFIKTPEEWLAIPGSLEAIADLHHADYHVVVATNQSGIARGLLDLDMLGRIHQKMRERIHDAGGALDAVFFCPHGPDDQCDCRKPKPGLYRDIGKRLGVSLKDVPVIGDSLRDLQAAQAVGARPILVRTGKGRDTESRLEDTSIPVYDDLAHAVARLLAAD